MNNSNKNSKIDSAEKHEKRNNYFLSNEIVSQVKSVRKEFELEDSNLIENLIENILRNLK